MIFVLRNKEREEYRIPPFSRKVIGRALDCDIRVSHDSFLVSRKHLGVHTLEEEMFVEDLDSTNGTWINDKGPIRAYFPEQVFDRDRVKLGSQKSIPSIEIYDVRIKKPLRERVNEFLEGIVSRLKKFRFGIYDEMAQRFIPLPEKFYKGKEVVIGMQTGDISLEGPMEENQAQLTLYLKKRDNKAYVGFMERKEDAVYFINGVKISDERSHHLPLNAEITLQNKYKIRYQRWE